MWALYGLLHFPTVQSLNHHAKIYVSILLTLTFKKIIQEKQYLSVITCGEQWPIAPEA